MTAHLRNAPTVAMRLYAATLGFAIAALVSGVAPASASNLLGGTMSWVPDLSTPNTAVFTITVVHRRDDPDLIILSGGAVDGHPEVGDIYHDNSKVKSFFPGDGAPLQSSDIRFLAIAVDKVQN